MTLYFYAASWNTAWNSSVRCSDSASKYRCGQREPPLPFNYLRWTAQTGRSASQHIKINTVRRTSGALRRAFPSSFILPGLCSGPWTQGRGPRPVGTHSQAEEPWGQLWAESPSDGHSLGEACWS